MGGRTRTLQPLLVVRLPACCRSLPRRALAVAIAATWPHEPSLRQIIACARHSPFETFVARARLIVPGSIARPRRKTNGMECSS